MGITISNSQGLWLGFSLRSTPQHMWVMGVYIVWVRIECIGNDNLAKQNVSRVSCRKTLPARYSRKLVVSILSWLFAFESYAWHMHHFVGSLLASYPRKQLQSSISLECLHTHTLSHTQPLQIKPTFNTGYKRLNKITIKFGTELKPTKI